MAHKIPRCIEWVTSIHSARAGRHPRHRHQPPRPHRVPGRRPRRDRDRGAWAGCTINVRDELKRTWARETRLERQEKGLEGHYAAAHRQVRESQRIKKRDVQLIEMGHWSNGVVEYWVLTHHSMTPTLRSGTMRRRSDCSDGSAEARLLTQRGDIGYCLPKCHCLAVKRTPLVAPRGGRLANGIRRE